MDGLYFSEFHPYLLESNCTHWIVIKSYQHCRRHEGTLSGCYHLWPVSLDWWDIIPIIYQIELTELLMFTVRLFTCKGKKKKQLNHQCLIHSDLWIFQEPRSSSNASQVNLGEACWELGCVCRLLEMHSESPSRASDSLPPLFLREHCSLSVDFASF